MRAWGVMTGPGGQIRVIAIMTPEFPHPEAFALNGTWRMALGDGKACWSLPRALRGHEAEAVRVGEWLRSLEWAKTPSYGDGIMWTELFVAFELEAGPLRLQPSVAQGTIGASILCAVGVFMRIVRHLARASGEARERQAFKPSVSRVPRAAKYAVMGGRAATAI